MTLPNGKTLPRGVHIPGSFFRGGAPGAGGFGAGQAPGGFAGGRVGARRGFGGAGGGLLEGSTPSKQLTALLGADASRYTWVAAATGSNSASGYQLATGDPVMAIGGFNGTDPTPTLAQFERYVSEGRIHYYVGGGGGFGGGGLGASGTSTSSQIAAWVKSHFSAVTVGGATLYDLTSPTG